MKKREGPFLGVTLMLRRIDYWKKRCELAEDCIIESPRDLYMETGLFNVYNKWQKFLKTEKEP